MISPSGRGNKYLRHRARAVSILEMVVGLMVMIPVLVAIIDMILVTLGAQANDNCAREAVRMAASGDPAKAQLRATEIVTRTNASTSGFLSNLSLVSVTFSPADLLATETSLIGYGGVVEGTVTVETTVTVHPFLISFVHQGPFTFNSKQTCPVTYVVPNTAGGQTLSP